MSNIENYKLSEVFMLWWIRLANKIYLFFLNIIDYFILIKNHKLKKVDRKIKEFQRNKFSWEELKKEKDKVNIDNEELTYGETPYFTSYSILEEAKTKEGMTVYDLGSGLGRFAYLANLVFKTSVYGVEIIPSFVGFTKKLTKSFNLKNIIFIKEDLFKSKFYDADIVYIAGTCFKEKSKRLLIEKMESVKKGAKIITLSYFLDAPYLSVKKAKKMWFSWGWGMVYFHERV